MKLSIITVNLNNLDGLKKTYESIVCQTWKDYEWIVIDGGSRDGSKEFIQDIVSSSGVNLAYWCCEADKGVYNAMNKGILKAQGEYLSFMNSGDCFYETLTLQTLFSEPRNADVLYGNCCFVKKGGEELVHYPEKVSLGYFIISNLCHQATIIKTSLLKDSLYLEDYKIVSDWERMLNWSSAGKVFEKVNCLLAKYDFSGISSSNIKLLETEKYSVLSKFMETHPKEVEHEIMLLQNTIEYIDFYETRVVARLIARGHLREKIVRALVKILDKLL